MDWKLEFLLIYTKYLQKKNKKKDKGKKLELPLVKMPGFVKNCEYEGYLWHDPRDEFARDNQGDDVNG